ncbi:putative fumarate reductase [Secundilactobacillus oryzae JCM 18671]|uniref:Putative fumarate reductase n=1 Tax=Secundilactobacillus oryzae JCM 18671 TaxID=1291743 RepID=A0A081BKY2_9LACO|nr:putative fumarate reductase [Secundilactobacillus oryzae JCM 18671]
MVQLQDELDAAVAADKPYIFKADTIEELAEKMNLPVDKLTSTISTYNRYSEAGIDEDFGKDADYLVPVAEGPFYGFSLNVGAFCTMGGLQVTTENEVLSDDGKVIGGLYAAGNDSSGLVGDTYGPNMPGTCVGYAFYSGRNSGKNAVAYMKHDQLVSE